MDVNTTKANALLWKHDEVILPDSYNMTLKRLVNIERKMKHEAVTTLRRDIHEN